MSTSTRIAAFALGVTAAIALAGCGATVATHHNGHSTVKTVGTKPKPPAHTVPLLVKPTSVESDLVAAFRTSFPVRHLVIGLPPGTPADQFKAFEADPNDTTWGALQIPVDNQAAWFPPSAVPTGASQEEILQQEMAQAVRAAQGTVAQLKAATTVWLWVGYNRSKDLVVVVLAWK